MSENEIKQNDTKNEMDIDSDVKQYDKNKLKLAIPPKADNGKFLKGYAIALFTVAFILVSISIYVQYTSSKQLQEKVAKEVELNSNHPMIKNIQQINERLQKLLDEKTTELKEKERSFGDHLLLEQKKSENLKVLLNVQNLYIQGKKKAAKTLFKTVDKDLLPDDSQSIYDYLAKKLK